MAMVGTSRAAKRIGCTPRSVQRWCLEGFFRTARRKGRSHWVIEDAEIEEKIVEFTQGRGKKQATSAT